MALAARLISKLERERFDPTEGEEIDRAYRRGWNDRCNELIRHLRVEAGLEELASAPVIQTRILEWDLSDANEYGGESG